MKILIGLGVLQTIALLVLIAFIASDRGISIQQPNAATNSDSNSDFREVHAGDGTVATSIDEQRLRSIIREELAAQQSAGTRQHEDVVRPEADPRMAAIQREQRERVAQSIESYKGIGTITDQQMQELQDEIGQLDEQSRNQMLRSLMRALNTGAVKGRLQ